MPINRRGSVAKGTRKNLIKGIHSSPMLPEAVNAIFKQAADFANDLVNEYERSVASGEVGVGGTGRVAGDLVVAARQPTALLYGRVQSGKTAAMVLTAAVALDNGFRVVMVLTADNVELVRQTADRFRDLDGPRVLSTLNDEGDAVDWRAPEGVEDDFLEGDAGDGLVFVCAKNARHSPPVLAFLQKIDAAAYPCLVFDDEADAATPDTTMKARTSGGPNPPPYPSTIHRQIVENSRPGEEGKSMLEVLPHSIYVQVTASPFVLLLQRETNRIRPTLTVLLEPGDGYCGGERFFGRYDPESDDLTPPPLVIVPDSEYASLSRRTVPPVLASSIEFAILSAAANAHIREGWPEGGFKHLSHTSPRMVQHSLVAEHVGRCLRGLRTIVRNPSSAREVFNGAYAELRRSLPGTPRFDSLLAGIQEGVRHAQVLTVNAETERPHFGPRVNFLVGGNILGRGLTIDNLLVTYYLRQAQVSQMDTVLQHARMYGYRESIMPFTRVYLPQQLAVLFQEIHQSEEELRSVATRRGSGESVPIRVAHQSRATRPGALEMSGLRVYGRNLTQVSPTNMIDDPLTVDEVRRLLLDNHVPLDEPIRNRRPTTVSFDVFRRLIELLEPPPDDSGRWSVDAILGLINLYRDAYDDSCTVYARGFEKRPDEERTRARLSGPEIEVITAASPNGPALAMMYWETAATPELWYPTLVFEKGHQTYVFSP